jgi:ferredoxin
MVGDLTAALRNAGIPWESIHSEAFGPSAVPASMAPVKEQTVSFAKSGGSMTWVPGKGSLLDQLAAAGRVGASGCRAGQCESCIIPLLEGEVVHPEGTSLVDDDKCLPCVCVPLSAVTLDV